MPDFSNFSITRNGEVTVSIPRYSITCDIVDSNSGGLIRSFRTNFPAFLSQLTDDQIDEIFQDAIKSMILKKVRNG